MKLSRKTNTIIMWVLAIGLLVGMVVTFTPTVGGLFGGGQDTLETPVVLVNNQPITDQQVALARQNNPVFASVQEGEVGQDLQLLLIDNLIDRELLRQASANQRVSSAEVREEVNEWRREAGVAGRQNDQAYLAAIGRLGHTDATFRRAVEAQLRQQRYLDSLTEGVSVSDEEVRSFFEANRLAYQSEERIRARQIVVDDEGTAQELHARALAGEDFAALAREHSGVNPDRDGAIGAAEGSTEPRPVGRVALPGGVANAAFALRGAGVTEVVQSGGRYYIVQVEEYLPAEPQPFEEVEERVREDALAAKRSAELERALENLRANATIIVPEQAAYRYDDRPVARVGDHEIMASELARATYGNQQVQQFLTPDNAAIISGFFKPTVLNQLIEEELAYQGARELPQTFIGPRQQVASSALNYVSQDVEVSEEAIEAYYQANRSRFIVPATAAVTRASFDAQEDAEAFRGALLEGQEVEEAVAASGAELEDLGTVGPTMLSPEFDRVLFETDAFEPLEDGREVSDVLVVSEPLEEGEAPETLDPGTAEAETLETEVAETPTTETEATETDTADAGLTDTADTGEVGVAEGTALGDEAADAEPVDAEPVGAEGVDAQPLDAEAPAATRERYVVLVAARAPETVRSLEEVREQVRITLEAERRAELRRAWLDELRGRIEVEELYASVAAQPDLTFDPLEGETVEDGAVEDGTAEGEALESGEAIGEPAGQEAAGDETAPAEPGVSEGTVLSGEAQAEGTVTEEAETGETQTGETPGDEAEEAPERTP